MERVLHIEIGRVYKRRLSVGRVWINGRVAEANNIGEGVEVDRFLEEVLGESDTYGIIKQADKSRVMYHQSKRGKWVVKQYKLEALKHKVYEIGKRTPAWREWRGAHTLQKLGVRVLSPLALVDHPKGYDTGWSQTLVLPFVEGPTLADAIAEPDTLMKGVNRSKLAHAIGQQLGRMTRGGIINRDHKARNLMLDTQCLQTSCAPLVIDPAGLRRSVTRRKLSYMLGLLRMTCREHGVVRRTEEMRVINGFLNENNTLQGVKKEIIREAIHRSENWDR